MAYDNRPYKMRRGNMDVMISAMINKYVSGNEDYMNRGLNTG
jgi:hypothetical protein